ncbi:hypothetical protein EDD85DRAFT_971965 [Armillaria nabsnona]|nr:hypothetical protein EDD85DRAFT_971965 [Armillaria nabsnona]
MTRFDKGHFDPSFTSFLPDFHQPTRDAKITELQGHNIPPTDSEQAYLKSIISEGESALAVFNHKVSVATQLLRALEAERDQAIANVADAKAILHPMRKVPVDILYDILAICVDFRKDRPYRGYDSHTIPRTAPWSLSRVCSSWRNISIHSSNLWSYIQLNIQLKAPSCAPPVRYLARLLRMQIERTRDRDLDLQLETSGDVCDHPVFCVLISSLPYWRTATMYIDGDELETIRRNGGTLCRLQSLTVTLHKRPLPSGLHHLFKVFETSPDLRRIRIDSFRAWEYMGPSLMLLARITHLNISEKLTSNFFFVHVLPHMQSLEWLVLGGDDENVPLVELPKLSSLCIIGQRCSDSGVANTYSHLTVPSLTGLELCADTLTQCAFPMVAPSNAVTRLTLWHEWGWSEPGDAKSLIEFLRTLQSIRYMYLCCVNISSEFFREMALSPDVTPHLEHIHLIGTYEMQSTILEFARSRWLIGTLSKVTLGEKFAHSVAEDWWALRDEGLWIAVDLHWDGYKNTRTWVDWDA